MKACHKTCTTVLSAHRFLGDRAWAEFPRPVTPITRLTACLSPPGFSWLSKWPKRIGPEMIGGVRTRCQRSEMRKQPTPSNLEKSGRDPDRAQHASKRLLSIADVLDRVSISRSLLYELIKDPIRPFPSPVHFGRRSLWVESEVEDYMTSVIEAERNNQPSK